MGNYKLLLQYRRPQLLRPIPRNRMFLKTEIFFSVMKESEIRVHTSVPYFNPFSDMKTLKRWNKKWIRYCPLHSILNSSLEPLVKAPVLVYLVYDVFDV